MIFFVQASPATLTHNVSNVGLSPRLAPACSLVTCCHLTSLPLLLLMAIVGAMSPARRGGLIRPGAVVVPGNQVLTKHIPRTVGDLTPVVTARRARSNHEPLPIAYHCWCGLTLPCKLWFCSSHSQRSQPLPSTMLPAGTRRTLRQKPTALQKSGGRELVHC